MTIKIDSRKDEGEGRFRLFLPVPLGLLNIPFVWRFLPPEQKQYQTIAGEIVKALRDFKKKNGSWDLVDVHSADGDVVVIRV